MEAAAVLVPRPFLSWRCGGNCMAVLALELPGCRGWVYSSRGECVRNQRAVGDHFQALGLNSGGESQYVYLKGRLEDLLCMLDLKTLELDYFNLPTLFPLLLPLSFPYLVLPLFFLLPLPSLHEGRRWRIREMRWEEEEDNGHSRG